MHQAKVRSITENMEAITNKIQPIFWTAFIVTRLSVILGQLTRLKRARGEKWRQKRGLFPYLIYRRVLLQMKTKRLKKSINSQASPCPCVNRDVTSDNKFINQKSAKTQLRIKRIDNCHFPLKCRTNRFDFQLVSSAVESYSP